jgi:hypothetical protein
MPQRIRVCGSSDKAPCLAAEVALPKKPAKEMNEEAKAFQAETNKQRSRRNWKG